MSLPVFSHDPLPDSPRHIRLLEILQGDFGQHVICTLSTWKFDTAPPYVAISYTWGDPNSTTEVTVNERRMLVRKNCEYALQQVFHNTKSQRQYVWLDAICIDQSNIRERGHQVSFMGQLYKKSSQVIACVGPHADDSERLVALCREKESLLTDIHNSKNHLESAGNIGWAPHAFLANHKNFALRGILAMTVMTRRRLSLAFKAYTSRPYFTRVWVLQELYMGTSVNFACGSDILPSRILLALSHLFETWLNGHLGCRSLQSGSLVDRLVWYSYSALARSIGLDIPGSTDDIFDSTETARACLTLASGNAHLRDLSTTLGHVGEYRCADVRDKIYGILSLVDWYSAVKLQPDYEKNAFQIAVQVLGANASYPRAIMYDLVINLAMAFNLSLTHEFVQATIMSRCSTDELWPDAEKREEEPELAEHEGSSHHSLCTLKDSSWFWTKIHPCSTNEKRAVSARYSRSTVDDNLTVLLECKSVTVAKAPPNTKVGDLYLYPAPALCDNSHDYLPGLVVRPHHNSHFTIIGMTSRQDTKIRMELPGKHSEFEMRWHPEDALIFYMHALSPHDIDASISFRVCKTSNSSYAVRVSSAEDRLDVAKV